MSDTEKINEAWENLEDLKPFIPSIIVREILSANCNVSNYTWKKSRKLIGCSQRKLLTRKEALMLFSCYFLFNKNGRLPDKKKSLELFAKRQYFYNMPEMTDFLQISGGDKPEGYTFSELLERVYETNPLISEETVRKLHTKYPGVTHITKTRRYRPYEIMKICEVVQEIKPRVRQKQTA